MLAKRLGAMAAAVALAVPLVAIAAPEASALPSGWIAAGSKIGVIYANSPLRNSPQDDGTVLARMPVTTSYNPGGGYVTSVVNQPWAVGLGYAPWCEVNWKGIVGWTGCWRLFPALR